MFFLRRKSATLLTIEFHYEMNGREITLEESFIPEEKETLEAITDSLKLLFTGFRVDRQKESIEIWVRGNHMDYFFEVRVFCWKIQTRVERIFEEFNKILARI